MPSWIHDWCALGQSSSTLPHKFPAASLVHDLNSLLKQNFEARICAHIATISLFVVHKCDRSTGSRLCTRVIYVNLLLRPFAFCSRATFISGNLLFFSLLSLSSPLVASHMALSTTRHSLARIPPQAPSFRHQPRHATIRPRPTTTTD